MMKTLLLCLGLLGGPLWAANDAPLGVDEGARLGDRLERFYAGVPGAALVSDEFAGWPVVAILLHHVVRHMKEPGAATLARTVEVLDWAHALALGTRTDAPPRFLNQQISRNLARLFEHFKARPRAIDALALILEATEGWGSEHLPVLAKHAGRSVPAEALYFANLATAMEAWDPAAAQRMVDVIRAGRIARRTPEQWGLLGLSGHASVSESAQILLMAAHAYANGEPAAPVFVAGHPLRAALEHLMNEYRNDSAHVQSAVLDSIKFSTQEPGRESPKNARKWFYQAFTNNVLLDPGNPDVTYDGSISAAAAASRAMNAPPVKPAPLAREGNVVHVKFGCGKNLEG